MFPVIGRTDSLDPKDGRLREPERIEDLPYHLRWVVRRRAAGLTQKELARALALDPTVLSAYENGRRLPNPDAAAFDRRHDQAIAKLTGRRLTLREIPDAIGEQFSQLIAELARLVDVPLRVTRHKVAEDRSTYEVDVPERAQPPKKRRRASRQ